MSSSSLVQAEDEGLGDFLDELETVDVCEEDLHSWDEVESIDDVVSVSETHRTSSHDGASFSRSGSPPTAATAASTIQPSTMKAGEDVSAAKESQPVDSVGQISEGRVGNADFGTVLQDSVSKRTLPSPAVQTQAGTRVRSQTRLVSKEEQGVSSAREDATRPATHAGAAMVPHHQIRKTGSQLGDEQSLTSAAVPATAVASVLSTHSTTSSSANAPGNAAASQLGAALPHKPAPYPHTHAPTTAEAKNPSLRAVDSSNFASRNKAVARIAADKSAGLQSQAGVEASRKPAVVRKNTPHMSSSHSTLADRSGEHRGKARDIAAVQAQPHTEVTCGTRTPGGATQQQQDASTIAQQGSGKGWGGWAGLGSLSAKLTAAAATAVKDVSDLTDSFQQVLQDIANESSDAEEGGIEETVRRTRQQQQQHCGSSGMIGGDSAEVGGGESEEETALRQEVLARLEGEDSSLGRSVKVVDQHVEHLSGGAGKALSSLWGWGATLAQRVEQAATSAAKDLTNSVEDTSPADNPCAGEMSLKDQASEGLGMGLSERLGLLGRTARGFFEAGLPGPEKKGYQVQELSFEECYQIYGGQQAFDELEALSNECARLCNRIRATLADDDKANLDKTLALLAPMFDLNSEQPCNAPCGKQEVPAALSRGHAMIVDVAAAGCARADAMVTDVRNNATQLEAARGHPLEGTIDTPSDSSSETGPTCALSTTSDQALKAIRIEGVKRIAEVTSLCMERLHALGRGIQLQFRFGRPTNDGISWPTAPELKAELLRGQASQMLYEVRTVTDSFTAALLLAGNELCTRSNQAQYTYAGKTLAAELSSINASSKVINAVKSLMYIVWLTSVDRQLLQ